MILNSICSFLHNVLQVQINAKDCIHVMLYQSLDKKLALKYVLYGKTLEDPLEPPRQ